MLAVAKVIALLLDPTETDSSQAVKFYRQLVSIGIRREINVRLFAHTDASANATQIATLYHSPQRQKVVTPVSQSIALVAAPKNRFPWQWPWVGDWNKPFLALYWYVAGTTLSLFLFSGNELESPQLRHDLIQLSVGEPGQAGHKRERHVLVVPHPHLDGSQHAKIVFGHEPQVPDIELHPHATERRRQSGVLRTVLLGKDAH